MHEVSIAQSILSIAESAIPANNNAMISSVDIQVGELSGIELEALKFSFGIIRANTPLENAELHVLISKGEAECEQCKMIYHCPTYTSRCPICQSYLKKITKGREMKVLSITLDE